MVDLLFKSLIFACIPIVTLSSEPRYSHKFLESECKKPHKCSYVIELDKRYSKEELIKYGEGIRDISPNVERVFIAYYLSCMTERGVGYWARTDFTPDLRVYIDSESNSFYELNPNCIDENHKPKQIKELKCDKVADPDSFECLIQDSAKE